MERRSKYHILVKKLYRLLIDSRSEPFLAGTSVLLKPGIISGGPVTHDCPLSRSVGYYLEPLLLLAPFAKKALFLTLRGITSNEDDLSVSHATSDPIAQVP